jgi:hypothetical protein
MRVMVVDGSRIEYNVFPAIVRSIGVHRHVRAHAVGVAHAGRASARASSNRPVT